MAVVLVGATRKPLRRIAGPRVAYWLWLVVPVNVIAVWLPTWPTAPGVTSTLQKPLASVIPHALVSTAPIGNTAAETTAALILWLVGACLLAAWFSIRQRSFVRSLECVALGPDAILRSERIGAPMLVGAWRPRVVIPADFEARYPPEERVLMLDHEQAHRERGDAFANLIAIASLCLLWFNPLMYWGLGRFRFDQEVACDAHVLARSGSSRKRYAHALLQAQIAAESFWRVPLGCHWQSGHPLKERITMLKLPSLGIYRRISGVAVAVVFTAFSAYTVSSSFAQAPLHSALPAVASKNNPTAADKTFSIEAKNTDTRAILAMIARKGNTNILVSDKVSGKMTVALKDVTWQQALHIVVLSQGLVARQSGNITMIGVSR
jgi:beta-lactamase regulating signal transducer with metallopeptidase domain